MRILLIAGLERGNPTTVAVLAGLGKAYVRRGHSVAAVALGARSGRRALSAAALRRADLVHFHCFHGHLEKRAIDVWRACRAAGASPLITFQAYGDPWGPRPRAGEKALLGAFLGEARRVTALSRFCAAQIEADVPSLAGQVRVVPDGYDPGERTPVRPASSRRASVVCVARLTPAKGIDVLLEAWKIVSRRSRAVLKIVGPDEMIPRGRWRRQARRLGIAGDVRFLGRLPRARVWAELDGSLFAVHPSRYESFGMAVVEAMGAGKAVVAARSGGPEEIVRHGVTGLLTPSGNPRALAAAILRLLEDPDLRRRLEAGAVRAARKYRWSGVAGRYLELIRSSRA